MNNLGLPNCAVFDGESRRVMRPFAKSRPSPADCTSPCARPARSDEASPSVPNQFSSNIVVMNPQVYTEKFAKDYARTTDGKFTSNDARLFNAPHDERMRLDNTPITGEVKLSEVYSDKLKGYGKSYKRYSDINAGQIMYYQDRSIQEPYFNPLFTTPNEYATVMYRDPMGGVSAEYPRKMRYPNPVASGCDVTYAPVGGPDVGPDGYNLTFLRDTQLHREDLLSWQMAKMNKNRYSNRYPL